MSKNCIYALKSNNSELSYIGSTRNYASARKAQHRYHHRMYMEDKSSLFCASFNVLNCDLDPELIILEEGLEHLSSKDFHIREGYWIDKKKEDGWDVTNMLCPYHDEEYYRQQRKKKYIRQKSQKRAYYMANREKILAKQKANYHSKKKIIHQFYDY